MKLVDAHAHLSDNSFEADIGQVILRAKESSIATIVDCGLGVKGGLKSICLSERFRGYVYSTIGVDYGSPFLDGYEEMAQLILSNRDRIIGIGEIGLDYYTVKTFEDRLKLAKAFKNMIGLANRLSLPVIVHSRSAGRDAIRILAENGAERVLMHAFDGKASYAVKGVEAGFFFSIPPSVVRSPQKQKLVARVPLENMMLESDSPVLGADPLKRNEPANIVLSLREIARIKRLDPELVADETTRNACRLFGLRL